MSAQATGRPPGADTVQTASSGIRVEENFFYTYSTSAEPGRNESFSAPERQTGAETLMKSRHQH